MLDAVFFDLDDTLVDQRGAADAAVVQWAGELGVDTQDPDAVRDRWARISDHHYSRYQRRELSFAGQRRARVREFLDLPDADDDELADLSESYLRRYEAAWTVFPDAVPALVRARAAGLAVCVLTNGDSAHQRSKMQLLGLDARVDVIVCSSELPFGKPHPGAFAHALRQVGRGADHALMVGNSLEKDVRGALACGWSAVLLDRYDRHHVEDVVRVRSLDEVSFG